MSQSISRTEKRGRGRPRTDSIGLHVSLHPDHVRLLDEWIAAQPSEMSRPEAIRRLTAPVLLKWHKDNNLPIWTTVEGLSDDQMRSLGIKLDR